MTKCDESGVPRIVQSLWWNDLSRISHYWVANYFDGSKKDIRQPTGMPEAMFRRGVIADDLATAAWENGK